LRNSNVCPIWIFIIDTDQAQIYSEKNKFSKINKNVEFKENMQKNNYCILSRTGKI
jgi:hypothetical protein